MDQFRIIDKIFEFHRATFYDELNGATCKIRVMNAGAVKGDRPGLFHKIRAKPLLDPFSPQRLSAHKPSYESGVVGSILDLVEEIHGERSRNRWNKETRTVSREALEPKKEEVIRSSLQNAVYCEK
ncbi:hypothetical protein FRC19_009218 [Serendipita sp. 401]|nr:hypothetical protein FRC19_009218 [Serendipita sp. 401]KAG9058440.1 hypothetical protein FS842_009508 [Serendipita sp. 407]